MRSKGNAPTAAQKRWHDAVASLGSIISGGPAVLHHAVGATAKHNKIHIGEWWVIPLTDEEHKALHRGERPWWRGNDQWLDCDSRKEFEKSAFVLVTCFFNEKAYGVTKEIRDAIQDYHR